MIDNLRLPFIWHASGCVPAIQDLTESHGVLAKSDVTAVVRGQGAGGYPLMVVELAGGKVVEDLKLASTSADVVIGGVQALFGCEKPQDHYYLRRRFALPRRRRGTAWLLGAANSFNYYHWLLDSLPRWKLLLAAGGTDYDYVLLHSQPCRFQDETLDLLGVPRAKRLRCAKRFVHQFDRLVVPAMPFTPFPARQIAPWICEWGRSLFPERTAGPVRLYLSRRGAQKRRLVNELELEARLKHLGFAIVQPEQLPVAEQAKLLGSATCIVAPHGAGLTNMLFAPPGARLIELLHPDFQSTCYKNLAAACGLPYTALVGRRTRELNNLDDRRAEYEIPVGDVLQVLE
jgi:capsular polysaccharide biosynthesis protein